MVNFGLLTAEICWRVWGTPANFNGFRVLVALLHGTLVVDASAKLCGVEQRAPPIFGRAAITLGIGPHSSWFPESATAASHFGRIDVRFTVGRRACDVRIADRLDWRTIGDFVGLTRNCLIQFFHSWLFIYVVSIPLKLQAGVTLPPLNKFRYSRWRPRRPPKHVILLFFNVLQPGELERQIDLMSYPMVFDKKSFH